MAKARHFLLESGEMGKRCSKCGNSLPLTSFYPVSKTAFRSWCKPCSVGDALRWQATEGGQASKKAADARYRESHREQAREYRHRPENVIRANSIRRERYSANPEPVRARNRAFRRANLKAFSESTKRSKAKNPEKYREISRVGQHVRRSYKRANGGKFTAAEWIALCEKYGNKCLCCGCTGKLEADHVIPLSKGGKNSIDNIQPLCTHCNRTKHTSAIDYRPK